MKRKEYNHACHWCKQRNWYCKYKYQIKNCPHWKIGKCLKCVYYKNGEQLSEKETDRWFSRGCETFFPDAKSFCHNYIPFNFITKWLYDKGFFKN